MGKEGRHGFQPDRLSLSRDSPDAGQIPGADLRGLSGESNAEAGEFGQSPVHLGLRTTGLGIGKAKGMIGKNSMPRLCGNEVSRLRQICDDPSGRLREFCMEEAKDRDFNAVNLKRRCHNGLDILPPWGRNRNRGHGTQDRAVRINKHQTSKSLQLFAGHGLGQPVSVAAGHFDAVDGNCAFARSLDLPGYRAIFRYFAKAFGGENAVYALFELKLGRRGFDEFYDLV